MSQTKTIRSKGIKLALIGLGLIGAFTAFISSANAIECNVTAPKAKVAIDAKELDVLYAEELAAREREELAARQRMQRLHHGGDLYFPDGGGVIRRINAYGQIEVVAPALWVVDVNANNL